MDFLLKKLIKDVKDWYCEHFDGFDLEERSRLHCRILQSYYDKKRFAQTKNLNRERKIFLEEVQNIMNLEVIKRHNQM